MKRAEIVQHCVVVGLGLALAGVLTYLVYFGAWSH